MIHSIIFILLFYMIQVASYIRVRLQRYPCNEQQVFVQ